MLKPTDYLIKLVLMIARPYRSVINLPHDHPTVSSFKGAAERRSSAINHSFAAPLYQHNATVAGSKFVGRRQGNDVVAIRTRQISNTFYPFRAFYLPLPSSALL